MLYDTIRNPNAPYICPKNLPDAKKDIPESIQQRLNRETIERVRNPRRSHLVIIQAVKYLLLAIVILPYLCCYGLPRWFLFRLLPKLFLMMKERVLHAGRFVQELSRNTYASMRGIFRQLLVKVVNVTSQIASYFWKPLLNVSTKFCALLKSLSQQSLQLKACSITALRTMPIKFFMKIRAAIAFVYRSMKEAVNRVITTISQYSVKFLQSFPRETLLPRLHLISFPFFLLISFLRARLKNALRTPLKAGQKMRRSAFLFKENFQAIAKTTKEKAKQGSSRIREGFMIEGSRKKIKSLFSGFHHAKAQFFKAMSTTVHPIYSMNRKVIISLANFRAIIQSSYSVLIQHLVQIWRFFLSIKVKFSMSKDYFFRLSRQLKDLMEFIFSKVVRLLHVQRIMVARILRGLKGLKPVIVVSLKRLIHQCAKIPVQTKKIGMSAKGHLERTVSQSISALRLIAAWTFAFVYCTILTLQESFDP